MIFLWRYLTCAHTHIYVLSETILPLLDANNVVAAGPELTTSRLFKRFFIENVTDDYPSFPLHHHSFFKNPSNFDQENEIEFYTLYTLWCWMMYRHKVKPQAF